MTTPSVAEWFTLIPTPSEWGMLTAGKKIDAIRYYRIRTGLALRPAKLVFDLGPGRPRAVKEIAIHIADGHVLDREYGSGEFDGFTWRDASGAMADWVLPEEDTPVLDLMRSQCRVYFAAKTQTELDPVDRVTIWFLLEVEADRRSRAFHYESRDYRHSLEPLFTPNQLPAYFGPVIELVNQEEPDMAHRERAIAWLRKKIPPNTYRIFVERMWEPRALANSRWEEPDSSYLSRLYLKRGALKTTS